MQHGEAMAEDVDPARPLTEAGRDAVHRVAERAGAASRVDICVHSGRRAGGGGRYAAAIGTDTSPGHGTGWHRTTRSPPRFSGELGPDDSIASWVTCFLGVLPAR